MATDTNIRVYLTPAQNYMLMFDAIDRCEIVNYAAEQGLDWDWGSVTERATFVEMPASYLRLLEDGLGMLDLDALAEQSNAVTDAELDFVRAQKERCFDAVATKVSAALDAAREQPEQPEQPEQSDVDIRAFIARRLAEIDQTRKELADLLEQAAVKPETTSDALTLAEEELFEAAVALQANPLDVATQARYSQTCQTANELRTICRNANR